MTAQWQLNTAALTDAELIELLVAAHQEMSVHLSFDMLTNPALPTEVRALRQVDGWRLCLVLTPWMLARLYLPVSEPPFNLPQDWTAEARANAEWQVIGPAMQIELAGANQTAHLNYDAKIGHFLLQPLVQSMQGYNNADELYQAWNQVLLTREENMKKMSRDCPLQKEMSRREFFRLRT